MYNRCKHVHVLGPTYILCDVYLLNHFEGHTHAKAVQNASEQRCAAAAVRLPISNVGTHTTRDNSMDPFCKAKSAL